MTRAICCALAILAAIVAAPAAQHVPTLQAGDIVITGGQLFDSVRDTLAPNTGIVVRRGIFLEVGANLTGRDTSAATVLGSQLREDEGTIYLWLQPEGCEPTAYRMAWSKDLAQQIQDAIDGMAAQGGGILLFERSLETREPKIYPMPVPALPPKPPVQAPMVVPEQSA